MTPEEREAAYHTLVTCDGKGKEIKAEMLRRLIDWHRQEAVAIECKHLQDEKRMLDFNLALNRAAGNTVFVK